LTSASTFKNPCIGSDKWVVLAVTVFCLLVPLSRFVVMIGTGSLAPSQMVLVAVRLKSTRLGLLMVSLLPSTESFTLLLEAVSSTYCSTLFVSVRVIVVLSMSYSGAEALPLDINE